LDCNILASAEKSLKRTEALPHIRERPQVGDRPAPLDPEVAQPQLNRIWEFLQVQDKCAKAVPSLFG
jgi:hypothetical protein